jgi:hypothetical protein
VVRDHHPVRGDPAGPGQQQAVIQSQSGHYIALLLNRADAVMPDELQPGSGAVHDSLDERLEPRHDCRSGRTEGATEGRAADDSGSGSAAAAIGSGRKSRTETAATTRSNGG